MKFRTDHFTLGRIVLGLGALSFLRFVEADFAQCVPGWDWVRSSASLMCHSPENRFLCVSSRIIPWARILARLRDHFKLRV